MYNSVKKYTSLSIKNVNTKKFYTFKNTERKVIKVFQKNTTSFLTIKNKKYSLFLNPFYIFTLFNRHNNTNNIYI